MLDDIAHAFGLHPDTLELVEHNGGLNEGDLYETCTNLCPPVCGAKDRAC